MHDDGRAYTPSELASSSVAGSPDKKQAAQQQRRFLNIQEGGVAANDA
jgi:hypothetical protein